MPDELEIISDSGDSRPSSSMSHQGPSSILHGRPIPKTVVEKVDPATPSHGDIPGTAAHSKRKADAVPDVVLQTPDSEASSHQTDQGSEILAKIPIPKTVVTKVTSEPSHGEVPDTDAIDMRKGDAEPNVVEKKGDILGKQTDVLLGSIQRANDQIRFTNLFKQIKSCPAQAAEINDRVNFADCGRWWVRPHE